MNRAAQSPCRVGHHCAEEESQCFAHPLFQLLAAMHLTEKEMGWAGLGDAAFILGMIACVSAHQALAIVSSTGLLNFCTVMRVASKNPQMEQSAL